jgi:hypothetical protein
MEMKIIHPRERYEETIYFRFYEYGHSPGAGFSFECDENGIVNMTDWSKVKHKNYNACVLGVINNSVVKDRGVESRHHTWTQPAVGECECGDEVVLSGFTNTCECCGADYNMSGQRLAPREQWGAETGESVADILSVDYTDRLLGD